MPSYSYITYISMTATKPHSYPGDTVQQSAMEIQSERRNHLCTICSEIFLKIPTMVENSTSNVVDRFHTVRDWTINEIGQRCHLCALLCSVSAPEEMASILQTSIENQSDRAQFLVYELRASPTSSSSIDAPKRFRLSIYHHENCLATARMIFRQSKSWNYMLIIF
jgi:hypothetical protein